MPSPWRTLLSRRALPGCFASLAAQAAPPPPRLVVYYAASARIAEFAGCRWAILDSELHPPLAPLHAQGCETFGYLSIGEVDSARPWFAEAAASPGLLLEPNPDWPDARRVDLRHPAWEALLLDRLVPRIAEQGFAGLFLDTADSAELLEQRDPARHAGMVAAAARLLHRMQARFPALKLVLNRGYQVQPLAGAVLHGVLAESVYGGYDFARRRYRAQSPADVRWQLDRLAALKARFPDLLVFTLDYLDPRDRAGRARIYAAQRAAGFIPYVATIDLHRIIPEHG
jgi:uncharacterized protein (TIGR01370 family)